MIPVELAIPIGIALAVIHQAIKAALTTTILSNLRRKQPR